jgi:long-subunit acyl-CoA synthetase (AMP-forming)
MRKIIIGLIAVMMVSMMTMPTMADTTQTIVITIENYAEASIILNETTWYTIAPLDSNETKPFNLMNNASVTVDVDIKATNTTNWKIMSSSGANDFALQFNNTGGLLGTETITYTDSTFYNGLTYDGDVDFVLTLYLPTSSSVATPQEITVTFTATAN